MTEDDRMEFLRQSIESHDRQLGELAEQMDITRAEIRELNQTVRDSLRRIDALDERVDRLAQTTQLNFDRLTKAMMGLTEHVVNHQHRLEALESNQDPGHAR
jgi:chromosome segregation ATPase